MMSAMSLTGAKHEDNYAVNRAPVSRAVEGPRSLFGVGKRVANAYASQQLTVVQIFRPKHVAS